MADRPTWRDRFPEEVTCIRCLEVYDIMYLDRLLWCERCRREARERAAWWGWVGGIAFGAWLGTIAAAVWLGQKVAREFVYGMMRFRNRRAVEARPPEMPPPRGSDSEPAE